MRLHQIISESPLNWRIYEMIPRFAKGYWKPHWRPTVTQFQKWQQMGMLSGIDPSMAGSAEDIAVQLWQEFTGIPLDRNSYDPGGLSSLGDWDYAVRSVADNMGMNDAQQKRLADSLAKFQLTGKFNTDSYGLAKFQVAEQTAYLQRASSPYAQAIADYIRQNPGKTAEDFKRLTLTHQNKYLDKYLQEGPVSRAIGTALLGLGLMGSPNADAGPDSAAYKAGYDGVQSILSMPGKLYKKATATDFKPFDIRNDKPSKSDPAYQKVAYATCQTIASMVDKDLTPRLVQKGETFYDIKSDTPSEQAPRFTLKDNGKGKGSCVFQYTTYKTAYTGTPFDPKIFQTRQIQMVWRDYVITDVQYIANPKGTQPSVGLVTDPSDRSQAINLHKNEDKRVAPKQVKDITNYALAGATINLKVLTDNYDKK